MILQVVYFSFFFVIDVFFAMMFDIVDYVFPPYFKFKSCFDHYKNIMFYSESLYQRIYILYPSLVRPILFNCLDEQLIWRQFKRPAGKTDQNLYACDGGADACVTALKELQPPTDWPTPWWTHNTHPHFHTRSP